MIHVRVLAYHWTNFRGWIGPRYRRLSLDYTALDWWAEQLDTDHQF